MPTILLSAPYIIPIVDRFRPLFQKYGVDLIIAPVQERLEEDQILAFAGQFDAALCGDDRYSARVLEACSPRLKVISKWGTGIDSIDSAAAARLGIQVCRTPNAFTLPVTDTILGYMLVFVRRLIQMDRAMKNGVWDKIPGRSLSECTLGVIGVGNIGKALLRRARAFGMHLLGNDIIPIAPDFLLENCVESVGLEELLHRSDFVSLNCDLNPTSFHLMNPQTFAMMKPTAYLINAARGPIVQETALIAALQNSQIAGAALDVYEFEPLPHDSPLLKLYSAAMDNVLLAPHNANSSPAAWERVHRNTVRNALLGLGITPNEMDFPS